MSDSINDDCELLTSACDFELLNMYVKVLSDNPTGKNIYGSEERQRESIIS